MSVSTEPFLTCGLCKESIYSPESVEDFPVSQCRYAHTSCIQSYVTASESSLSSKIVTQLAIEKINILENALSVYICSQISNSPTNEAKKKLIAALENVKKETELNSLYSKEVAPYKKEKKKETYSELCLSDRTSNKTPPPAENPIRDRSTSQVLDIQSCFCLSTHFFWSKNKNK